jgi:hypothetical protein
MSDTMFTLKELRILEQGSAAICFAGAQMAPRASNGKWNRKRWNCGRIMRIW